MAEKDVIAFESTADQQGFTIFPNVVLLDESLSQQARLTYAMLAYYARQDGSCFPGQGTLAKKLGVKDRMVRNYLTELQEAMLIRIERRGQMKSNRYVMLALGLRAKRLAERDRQQSADQGDRQHSAAVTGNQLPLDEEAGTITQKERESGTREKLKVAGKPVQKQRWELTRNLLAAFNEKAGRKYRLLKSSGQPSTAATYIYKRIHEYPDLTLDEHLSIIDRTLASKWWGDDQATFNVVYGPNVFEENITRPGIPRRGSRRETRGSMMERIEGLKSGKFGT